jgi:hypothetical protein
MFIVTINFSSNICLRHVYLTAVIITRFHIQLTFNIASPHFTAMTEDLKTKAEYIRHRVKRVSYLMFPVIPPLNCTVNIVLKPLIFIYKCIRTDGGTVLYTERYECIFRKNCVKYWSVFSNRYAFQIARCRQKEVIWTIIWNRKIFWYWFYSFVKFWIYDSETFMYLIHLCTLYVYVPDTFMYLIR